MSYFSNSKKTLNTVFVLLPLFLLSTHPVEAGQKRYVVIRPENQKGEVLSIQGRERTYYQLGKSKEIEITLEGPGKLKVLSRLNFPPNVTGVQKYTLEIKEGGKVVKSYSTTTEKSGALSRDQKFVPGKSRKFTLNVPRGAHSYGFYLKEASLPGVSLKFLYDSYGDSGKLASLTPVSYFRVTSASIKEKPISYFVATTEVAVRLRVIGPTKLRIVSRLNYDARMKGEQKYAILASENGRLILTKPFLTSKSLGVEYKDWKEVVPGKSRTSYLPVPAGEHIYAFKLGESIAKSVSLRFSIPDENLTNKK